MQASPAAEQAAGRSWWKLGAATAAAGTAGLAAASSIALADEAEHGLHAADYPWPHDGFFRCGGSAAGARCCGRGRAALAAPACALHCTPSSRGCAADCRRCCGSCCSADGGNARRPAMKYSRRSAPAAGKLTRRHERWPAAAPPPPAMLPVGLASPVALPPPTCPAASPQLLRPSFHPPRLPSVPAGAQVLHIYHVLTVLQQQRTMCVFGQVAREENCRAARQSGNEGTHALRRTGGWLAGWLARDTAGNAAPGRLAARSLLASGPLVLGMPQAVLRRAASQGPLKRCRSWLADACRAQVCTTCPLT